MAPATRSRVIEEQKHMDEEMEKRIHFRDKLNYEMTRSRSPSLEHFNRNSDSNSSLFELAPEIRNFIYRSAAQYSSPLYLDGLSPAPWMLASKLVLHESTPIYLQSNKFTTLIRRESDIDEWRSPATGFDVKTLCWLADTNCLDIPLIRDVGFAFAYDKQDRDTFFRLAIHNGKPFLAHGHCVFCDEHGHGPHVKPIDPNHHAITPENLAKPLNHVLASLYYNYTICRAYHDSELDSLNAQLDLDTFTSRGFSVLDIGLTSAWLRYKFADGPPSTSRFFHACTRLDDCNKYFKKVRMHIRTWDMVARVRRGKSAQVNPV